LYEILCPVQGANTGGFMSEKNRLKKDGSDKNQEQPLQRAAEANPELKRELSAGNPKGKFSAGEAKAADPKHNQSAASG
jgi:hypothetical protein